MHIADILATKGHRIETVWPTQRARDIPKIFVDRHLSSVIVVTPSGQPQGIISDRHILAAMAAHDGMLAHLTARDIMASPVPTCRPEDGVVSILRRMTDERIRHMVVMDGDRMTGVVSIGDLVKHRFQDTELEMRVLRDLAYAHMVN
jgi:CBS domain-containing protein